MPRRKTTKEFIKEAKEVHDDKYDYSKVKYTTYHKKIIIVCSKHKEFKQTPANHLSGKGCPKCIGIGLTNKERIDKLKKERDDNGEYYNYSKLNYINVNKKIIIICPIHGEFEQLFSNHLNDQGCPKCSNKNLTEKERIINFKKIHGDKYNYSSIDYKDWKTPIKIICKKHGEFKQIPNDHLSGHGCPQCANTKISNYNRTNPTGWKYSNWVESGNNSKNFDSFKLYIIKVKGENKNFYKIGRTYRNIKRRFKDIPYDYELIYIKESNNGREICELEEKFKRVCKDDSYIPNKEFNGMYECFKTIEKIKNKNFINL